MRWSNQSVVGCIEQRTGFVGSDAAGVLKLLGSTHVRGLQRPHRGVLRHGVPIPALSGDPVPQVHWESATAYGVSAGVLQPGWRRIDLDSRGLGWRGADGPGALAAAA